MPQTENSYHVKYNELSSHHVGGNLPLAFLFWEEKSADTVRNSPEHVPRCGV